MRIALVLAVPLLAAGVAAQADTLLVDRVKSEPVASMPGRGQTMDRVLSRFGEPAQRLDAVGGERPQHPPITRWVYPSFTVYFERSLVITAVANRAAANELGPKPAN
jgi:hypothetical protein